MKIALCCIGRMENRYAVEYVEHYKKIGVDKIFIYDNNHDNEEHFEDVLQEYIDKGIVQIIDYRNKTNLHNEGNIQLQAYNHCYNSFGDDFDYMCFFDFDEFLTFVEPITIKEYLERGKQFDMFLINWKIYTDNNLVRYEDKPIQERFTQPMELTKSIMYNNIPENFHVKTICRTKKHISWAFTPHMPASVGLTVCNGSYEPCSAQVFQSINYEKAYLKHFTTKTIEEWMWKLSRGVPDRNKETFLQTYSINRFFKYNEQTEEKMKFITENYKKIVGQ